MKLIRILGELRSAYPELMIKCVAGSDDTEIFIYTMGLRSKSQFKSFYDMAQTLLPEYKLTLAESKVPDTKAPYCIITEKYGSYEDLNLYEVESGRNEILITNQDQLDSIPKSSKDELEKIVSEKESIESRAKDIRRLLGVIEALSGVTIADDSDYVLSMTDGQILGECYRYSVSKKPGYRLGILITSKSEL